MNSDGATADDLNQQFLVSGINSHAYTPPSPTTAPKTWPTLQELITAKTRLLTFVADLHADSNTVAPYLMDEFVFLFENPYEVTNLNGFTCEPDRPSTVGGDASVALGANMLPLMNHMLYDSGAFGIMTPAVENITVTNSPKAGVGTLKDAALDCKSQYSGRNPSFLLVDFFDQGPAIDTADSLNGVTAPVGRKRVPDSNSQALQSSGASSANGGNLFRGLFDLTNSVQAGVVPTLGNWIWVGGDWGPLLGGGFAL